MKILPSLWVAISANADAALSSWLIPALKSPAYHRFFSLDWRRGTILLSMFAFVGEVKSQKEVYWVPLLATGCLLSVTFTGLHRTMRLHAPEGATARATNPASHQWLINHFHLAVVLQWHWNFFNFEIILEFEVLTAVNKKSYIFWVRTPFGPLKLKAAFWNM
jgi:hypothetical protein